MTDLEQAVAALRQLRDAAVQVRVHGLRVDPDHTNTVAPLDNAFRVAADVLSKHQRND